MKPTAVADWGKVAPELFGRVFTPRTAEKAVADCRALRGDSRELVGVAFDRVELKMSAVLGREHAAEWLPVIGAMLRLANAHGAQGDVAIAEMDGPSAFFAELRKNGATVRTLDDAALKKALGWSLRTTLRQPKS